MHVILPLGFHVAEEQAASCLRFCHRCAPQGSFAYLKCNHLVFLSKIPQKGKKKKKENKS